MTIGPRVVALVVTYNRSEVVRQCLDALLRQTRPPEAILVVENGSTDGTLEMLRRDYPTVGVLPITVNDGASAGFCAGLTQAAASGFDWIWIMDDDAAADENCLELLLARADSPAPAAATRTGAPVYVPMQIDSRGVRYGFGLWHRGGVDATPMVLRGEDPPGVRLFGFVGPLLPARLIAGGVLPNARFYIWFDDLEFALRIQHEGLAHVVYVPEAIVRHDFGQVEEVVFFGRRRKRIRFAPWKLYYGARNYLYTLVRTAPMRHPGEFVSYFRQQFRSIAGELLFEPDRFVRVGMRLRGMADGLFGRMGKRV